ncbi:MAG: LTA synthase family protein [Bacilli bacterium]|nr:LTA synthase family protein [Bacilli bacterium]
MKRFSDFIKKLIAFIMFIFESCVSALTEDILLMVFLIVAIIPNLLIKIMCDMPIFNLRSLMFNLAWFCLVVALSYNYKRKKSRLIYFGVVTFLMYLLIYANILYNRFYEGSFLSLSLIKQLRLLPDVADAPASSISPFDVLYWIFFFIALGLLIYLTIKKQNKAIYKNKQRMFMNKLNFLRTALFFFVFGIVLLAPANYSQAAKLWNRPIVVQDFGLYNYHILDIIKSVDVFIEHEPDEDDYDTFLAYFQEKNRNAKTNEYTNILKGKNIIVIHAESLENFLINLRVQDLEGNEVEVTPNFNRLAREGLYFSNFYSQQSIGTSADSEFVFNTSLLPVNNGTVFLTHFNRTYVTTQSLLQDQGYVTMYMHGNNGSFWNRDVMYTVLGYDLFLDKSAYTFNENQTIGLGISDYEFFQQSISYLANTNEPYYATLITLTNHTPWMDVDKYVIKENGVEVPDIDCEAISENFDKATTCRYLKSARYMDWALGEFLNEMENRDLLENTAVVVYGDHPAKLPKSEIETLFGLEEGMTKLEYNAFTRVPFIIWYPEAIEPKEVTMVMGEYDAGPTLQNMLGIKNQYALGNDIFNLKENIVAFINGDWTDGIVYYSYSRDDYYITNPNYTEEDIQTMILENNYINMRNDQVAQIIEMSNLINKYDLIGYHQEKLRGKRDRGYIYE